MVSICKARSGTQMLIAECIHSAANAEAISMFPHEALEHSL